MNQMKIFLTLSYFFLIKFISADINIRGYNEGYKIEKNIITFFKDDDYYISGIDFDKSIIINCSCQIYLSDLTLISRGSLTPIIIEKNYTVTLTLEGQSILIDSEGNENEGVIYLKEKSKLIIGDQSHWCNYNYYQNGILNIIPNKLYGIKGEGSTSFICNGPYLKIISTSNNAGGIYIGKNITFEFCNFFYDGISGKNHAIESEDDFIFIISGNYNINSENGKGIKTRDNLYIGRKGDSNSNLVININTLDEGIESKDIEIFSGTININGKKNGISAINDICKNQKCSGNCNCYIKFYDGIININSEKNGIISNGDLFIIGGQLKLFGSSTENDQPIKKDGVFKIKGGTFLYGGNYNIAGGLTINSSQTEFSYNQYISEKTFLRIYDNNDDINEIKEIISIKIPINIQFLYFNYTCSNFTIKCGEKEIGNSENQIRALITSESETEQETEYSTISPTDKENSQVLPSNSNGGKNHIPLDSSKNKNYIENDNIINNNNICLFIRKSTILLFLFWATLF